MGNETEVRILQRLLEARMEGLRILNEALEGRVPEEMAERLQSWAREEVDLTSRLQKAIEGYIDRDLEGRSAPIYAKVNSRGAE